MFTSNINHHREILKLNDRLSEAATYRVDKGGDIVNINSF